MRFVKGMLKDQHSMRTVTKISDNLFNMHDKKVAIFSLSALCLMEFWM